MHGLDLFFFYVERRLFATLHGDRAMSTMIAGEFVVANERASGACEPVVQHKQVAYTIRTTLT